LQKRFGGAIRILADTRAPADARAFYGVDQYPGTVLMARADWMSSHPDEARRLACAVGQARRWAQSHTAAEVAARLPKSHRGDDEALYTEVIRRTLEMLTPDGRITAEGAEAARIGEVVADHAGMVTIRTIVGSERIVDMLVGEQLPRIC